MEKLANCLYKDVYERLEDYPFSSSLLYFSPSSPYVQSKTLQEVFVSYTNDINRGNVFVSQIEFAYQRKDEKGFFSTFNPLRPFVGYYALKTDKAKKGNIIVVPGGGYQTVCAIDEGIAVSRELSSYGYDCFILQYGTKEHASFPQAEDDLVSLVQYLFSHNFLQGFGYDIIGFSAGGHLVGLWGSERYGYLHYSLPKPNHIVLAYPVTTLGEESEKRTKTTVLAHHEQSFYKEIEVNSNISDNYPPVYLTRGLFDPVVPPSDSDRMEIALAKHHILHVYRIQDCSFHGFGRGDFTQAAGWLKEVDWFLSHTQR